MIKAKRIRELLAQGLANHEIIEALDKEGVFVSPQQVSNERSKLRNQSMVVDGDHAIITVKVSPDKINFQQLQKVKKLAEEIGLETLEQYLVVVKELQLP